MAAKTKTQTKTKSGAAKSASRKASAPARSPRTASARSGGGAGARNLVIVESPAKASTIGRFLGRDYAVKASMGHVRDLPQRKLGVNTEQDFRPWYEVLDDKRKVVGEIKEAGDRADGIYLATDPDREGEAIAWHVVEAAGWRSKPVRRVVFHSITEEAVKEAFANERAIDMELVNAQQARRIEDRLVGFKLSPLLKPLVGQEINRRIQSDGLDAANVEAGSVLSARARAIGRAAARRGARRRDRRFRPRRVLVDQGEASLRAKAPRSAPR